MLLCPFSFQTSLSRVCFEQLMENIIQHCVPGNLTELEVETGYDFRLMLQHFKRIPGYGWLEELRPILHGLEKLTLNNVAGQLEPVFKLYQRDLPNLRSLTLKNFDFHVQESIFRRQTPYPSWTDLFPAELSNVTEIYLIRVEINKSASDFELFLSQFTNLQVFVHLRRDVENLRQEVFADCLHRRFPQLRGIGCNVDDLNQRSTFFIGDRFSFLQRFTNLTELYVGFFSGPLPRDIHSLIQFVPNVKILSIVDVFTLFQPPVAVRRMKTAIGEVIDRRRHRFPPKDRIKIIVNEKQYRDFMVLKNLNEIIQLSLMVNTQLRRRS